MHARPRRGLVSRPSLIEVLEYSEQVDARMAGRFEAGHPDEEAARVVLHGTHPEQQHQELLLPDTKHALWCNPLGPGSRGNLPRRPGQPAPLLSVARHDPTSLPERKGVARRLNP